MRVSGTRDVGSIPAEGIKNKLLYFLSDSTQSKFPLSSEARWEIGGTRVERVPLGKSQLLGFCQESKGGAMFLFERSERQKPRAGVEKNFRQEIYS